MFALGEVYDFLDFSEQFVPDLETIPSGRYTPDGKFPIGAGHRREGCGRDEDVRPHPGVPHVTLDADEATSRETGARPVPEMGDGYVKDGASVLAEGVGAVEDGIAIANLQDGTWTGHLNPRRKFAIAVVQDGDGLLLCRLWEEMSLPFEQDGRIAHSH